MPPSYDARLRPIGLAGALPLPWFTKGEAGIGFLGLPCFGFFASRLLRFSPLAVGCLRCQSGLGRIAPVVAWLVEQMIEVGQHPVDQSAATQISSVQILREQTPKRFKLDPEHQMPGLNI